MGFHSRLSSFKHNRVLLYSSLKVLHLSWAYDRKDFIIFWKLPVQELVISTDRPHYWPTEETWSFLKIPVRRINWSIPKSEVFRTDNQPRLASVCWHKMLSTKYWTEFIYVKQQACRYLKHQRFLSREPKHRLRIIWNETFLSQL